MSRSNDNEKSSYEAAERSYHRLRQQVTQCSLEFVLFICSVFYQSSVVGRFVVVSHSLVLINRAFFQLCWYLCLILLLLLSINLYHFSVFQ